MRNIGKQYENYDVQKEEDMAVKREVTVLHKIIDVPLVKEKKQGYLD